MNDICVNVFYDYGQYVLPIIATIYFLLLIGMSVANHILLSNLSTLFVTSIIRRVISLQALSNQIIMCISFIEIITLSVEVIRKHEYIPNEVFGYAFWNYAYCESFSFIYIAVYVIFYMKYFTKQFSLFYPIKLRIYTLMSFSFLSTWNLWYLSRRYIKSKDFYVAPLINIKLNSYVLLVYGFFVLLQCILQIVAIIILIQYGLFSYDDILKFKRGRDNSNIIPLLNPLLIKVLITKSLLKSILFVILIFLSDICWLYIIFKYLIIILDPIINLLMFHKLQTAFEIKYGSKTLYNHQIRSSNKDIVMSLDNLVGTTIDNIENMDGNISIEHMEKELKSQNVPLVFSNAKV